MPSISGELTRELGQAKFFPTQLPAAVTAIVDYPFNNVSGTRQSIRLAATTTQLFKEVAGAWVAQSLINPVTGLASSTAPLADTPQFAIVNNLLHIADGTNSWIYDGPNAQFVVEGFIFPANTPGNALAGAGVITTAINKFYWYTFADHTAGRVHESSSSPISPGIGVQINTAVSVTVTAGTASSTAGSTAITTTSVFTTAMVGQYVYIAGVLIGVFATFINATHATLAAVSPNTFVDQPYLICPPRTTHIHIYGSFEDGDKLGKFHGSFAVTANPPVLVDNSPFLSDPTSTISNVDRPIRNDQPIASRIIEPHKYRIFRRQETKPNFFFFSGNEEISAGNGNGSPQESNPGSGGTATLSDLVDGTSYPQPANRIRALTSHADALWIGTENGVLPLYGNSIDDFGLMQIVTIPGGVISRWGMQSTGHGLVIFGYDRLLHLYPPISPLYNVTAQSDVTDQLVEIGRPMRKKFLAIKSADQDNVRTLYYKYNSRDWLVVCLQDSTSTYHTYIYDFTTKSWFESQRGLASVAVFEPTAGTKILVGGGTDGFVYVIDDLSSTYTNATLPTAQFRTALINFARPDTMHEPQSVEFELSNPTMQDDIAVNFYLDPQDADNPGTAIGPIAMALVPRSAARYRGYFAAAAGGTGVICKRLMVELNVVASTNAGALRGIILKSAPVDEEIV